MLNTNKHVTTRKRRRGQHKSSRERVRAFLGLFKRNDNVLVIINPDPDAMASALAIKRLLWKRVHSSTISYIGEIQRVENQAMMELLKILRQKGIRGYGRELERLVRKRLRM